MFTSSPDHFKLDAQISTSNSSDFAAKGFVSSDDDDDDKRLEKEQTQNVCLSGNDFYSSHGLSESTCKYP